MAGNRNNKDESLVRTSSEALATRMDDASSTVSYVGKASAGSSSSSAVWQIFKIDTATSPQLIITYADGNANYDNIWNNRASLTYS